MPPFAEGHRSRASVNEYEHTVGARHVGERAVVVHNSTPAAYEAWLRAAVDRARAQPPEHRIVFLNAWNEWTEGSYLLPDREHGTAYLDSVSDVVAAANPKSKI